MQLVEILLPVTQGDAVRREMEVLEKQLTERFGGMTAFLRSPGRGLWEDQGLIERDDVVVVEVMTETVDREWWKTLRTALEDRLGQKEIVIRTHAVERL
jgi:hypothetical protein